jgi:hypothetical protein
MGTRWWPSGKKEGLVGNTKVIKEQPDEKEVDTVTLYLNPQNQKQYYDYIFIPSPETDHF